MVRVHQGAKLSDGNLANFRSMIMVCVHQDFVAELVHEYGAAAVSGWRFRIGTEENAW